MKFKSKLKKVNKFLLNIYIILSLTFLIGIVLLSINLSYLVSIETFLRIIVIIILSLFLMFYILYGFVWLFSKKTTKLLLFSFFILIFSFITLYGSYYINKTYRLIDNIHKNKITYTTNLITLKDNNMETVLNGKVGIIDNEKDITGYILPKELIKKEKWKFELIKFEDNNTMLEALTNKEIQGLFIADNYDTLISDEETYSSILQETKVLKSYSKTMDKPKMDNVTNLNIDEPFTILLLGIDADEGDLSKNTGFRGDSIMLITFNPKTLSTTILSIPRDTFVPITCNKNKEAKINSAARFGASCMIDTITAFTGIEINYYVKMNFAGIVDLVDALGGIDVNVPYSFCEQNSKRQWGDHTVFVKEGQQKLNGEQALALSRNRHYPGDRGSKDMRLKCPEYNKGVRNDFTRGQNQQLVVQAIINKAKRVRNADTLLKILESISDNMDTNMQTNQILSFYNTGKKIIGNNPNNVLKVEKLYLQTRNINEPKYGSIEIPQQASVNAIVKAMKINLGLEEEIMIKTFSFDSSQPYEIPIIGKGLRDKTTRATIPNFIGKNKNEVLNFAKSNNIKVSVKEIDSTSSLYKEELGINIVISQTPPANSLLNLATKIEITYQVK